MEIFRPRGDSRFSLVVHNAQPVSDLTNFWTSAEQMAVIGLFVILFGTTLYICRGILVPVLAAFVVGTTFSPVVKYASKHGVPRGVTALCMVGMFAAIVGIGITLLAGPVTAWFARLPEIMSKLQQYFYILDTPLAALREIQNAITPSVSNTVHVETGMTEFLTSVADFVTPAATQLVVFVVTLLLYLVAQLEFRNFVVLALPSHETKLRFLRIANDVEYNLAGYLTVVTLINFTFGVIVGASSWVIGLPNPVILGLLAMILNYIPYIGPGLMTIILFAVGLVEFPSLGLALIAPLGFVALALVEGQIVTPTIIGRRLTLNPLTSFLVLAFWTWMWGPIGAFLAMPMTIIGLVTTSHFFPETDEKLPD